MTARTDGPRLHGSGSFCDRNASAGSVRRTGASPRIRCGATMPSHVRILAALCLVACVTAAAPVAAPAQAPRKRLLVIGEERGYRHQAVTHAMVTIARLGRETGLW